MRVWDIQLFFPRATLPQPAMHSCEDPQLRVEVALLEVQAAASTYCQPLIQPLARGVKPLYMKTPDPAVFASWFVLLHSLLLQ